MMGFRRDEAITQRRIDRVVMRRVLKYIRPYLRPLIAFVVSVILGSIAGALDVHPQTVRYRLNQLRELYGEGPLEIDFKAFGERASRVPMTRCELARSS